MKFIETEPKENVKLYAGILLLVALSFFAFSLRPAAYRLAAARSQYQALRQEVVTGKVRAKELLGYARRVTGLTSEVRLLERRLRTENQLLLFLKDAEQAAGHAGIQLSSIEPGVLPKSAIGAAGAADAMDRVKQRVAAVVSPAKAPTKAAPAGGQPAPGGDKAAPVDTTTVNKLPISVSVNGGLKGILHFVRHLERIPYPVRVAYLAIDTAPETQTAPGKDGAAPKALGPLQAVISLEMYSLINDTAGKAGEAL